MTQRAAFSLPEQGLVLPINKPPDWTSFDVVNKIRRMTRVKKVGHAGTLDPFATGVLLVCLGKATKRSDELMSLPKEYQAGIVFGAETDTLDVTGKIVAESPVPQFDEEQLQSILKKFIGVFEQEIPAYSAAKHQGRRMYDLARQGIPTPRKTKMVTVYAIELLEILPGEIKIRVECGRGTYIRALARDIARDLGTHGYVKTLVRTRVGDYSLDDCLTIESLQEQLNSGATAER